MDNVMDVCSQQRQLEEGVSTAGTSEAEALLDANSEDEAQLQIQVTPPLQPLLEGKGAIMFSSS